MPRPAHRRCKEQGPTCYGVCHPGFDICSRCLHDVVRPRQKEERRMMRERKLMRLSRENRALINETALKEPQMRPELLNWPEPPVDEAAVREELKALGDEITQDILANTRVDIHPYVPKRYRRKVAPVPPVEEEPVPPPVVQPPTPGHTRRHGKLTEEQEDEVIEMFKAGISTVEIQIAYAIGAQTLYTLIRRRGVPLRGRGLHKEKPVPEPVTSSSSASTIEVTVPTPNGVVSDLPEWVVTYEVVKTETVTVAAKDFNAAAQAAWHVGTTILSVARKR